GQDHLLDRRAPAHRAGTGEQPRTGVPRARALCGNRSRGHVPGGADGLRHHPGDEQTDAWTFRGALTHGPRTGPSPTTAEDLPMAKLRIGVLYDYWWEEDEERAASSESDESVPRPRRKSPEE